MLTPRQIVDTMLAQHGVATGDDVSKLRDPLSQAMTSLSDLTKHMASFLLASQRLNRSGQVETAYRYKYKDKRKKPVFTSKTKNIEIRTKHEHRYSLSSKNNWQPTN
jgi:hypothetical protein